ncbi:hypothetical protein Barb4_02225 [Bacteroidales bacterium Barb4]|nr:hypothetical protein Barb4_02225 [Bacteroidales bacterium Barb4]
MQCQSQRKEACTPLVRHRMTRKKRTLGKRLHNRRIPAAGTQHHVFDFMRFQQGNKLEYLLFVGIHFE